MEPSRIRSSDKTGDPWKSLCSLETFSKESYDTEQMAELCGTEQQRFMCREIQQCHFKTCTCGGFNLTRQKFTVIVKFGIFQTLGQSLKVFPEAIFFGSLD